MWSRTKYNLNYLNRFGCDAVIHFPKEKRRKRDLKATKIKFIGYCENFKV